MVFVAESIMELVLGGGSKGSASPEPTSSSPAANYDRPRSGSGSGVGLSTAEVVLEAPPPDLARSGTSAKPFIPQRELTVRDSRPKNFAKIGARTPGVEVISSFDSLTTEWLTSVFRFRGYLPADGTIDEITMKRIGEGQGEMSDLMSVTIVRATNAFEEPALPKHLVAKMWPQKMGPPPIALKLVFFAEAHFYNDFTVTAGGLPRPECFHCGAKWSWTWSNSPASFVFLLEDAVKGMHGMGGPSLQYQRADGCAQREHLMMVMDGLAKFHARWWGKTRDSTLPKWVHPLLSSHGLGPNVIPFLAKQGFRCLPKLTAPMTHPDGTPVASLGAEFDFILKEWLPLLKGRFRHVMRQCLRPPLTLVHGDCHLENIFFHDRYPGGCAFIDFGNMHFGQSLADVSFFLATNLEPDVRRSLERDLLGRYHATLVSFGVENYSFDLCWHDYKMNIFMAFVQIVTQAPDFVKMRQAHAGMFAHTDQIDEGSKTLLKMYAAQNRRCAEALRDHDWISMVAEKPKQCCDWIGCTPLNACVET